ncbi:MAG: PIN domain-containing protein [Planctomycetia bacterium]|nr:PIN domain-containing protein [Planctomycetia bacterium]
MALLVLRFMFVLVAAGLGVQLIRSPALGAEPANLPWLVFGGLMLLSAAVIGIDMFVRRKQLDTVSAVYVGLLVGLFLTYVLRLALNPILPEKPPFNQWSELVLGMVICYTCISLLLQTKDDFRFIIPYVEFVKEVKGLKPYVLDTSVVIDGRIADVVETKILDNQLIMPRFVIAELQAVADSSDRLRRSRGRRGLDILNRLSNNTEVDFKIYDRELPDFAGQPVDLKLVLLAKYLDGKIVTNDYNLNKVARLHGVGVINLNDLANALKPIVLPGENLEVRIVKFGEEAGQGVGYLDDGTMIVVEGGREHLNKSVKIAVTSVLQTSAGRMIFGRYETAVKV